MKNDELMEKINRLEYHQSLLLEMISDGKSHPFYRLIIKKFLSKQEVEHIYKICEELNNELEEQKAEGFVYFQPLFEKFQSSLPPKVHAREVVLACLGQQLFQPLMEELKKYI